VMAMTSMAMPAVTVMTMASMAVTVTAMPMPGVRTG
jgi:hypothetical protein